MGQPSMHLLHLFALFIIPSAATHDQQRDKFFDSILNGYDASEHPYDRAGGEKQQMITSISLFLYHMSVPNVPDPVVKYNGFVKLQWQDSRIGWNPSDFGGIRDAQLPYGYKIWTPKVIPLNRVFNTERLTESTRRTRTYLKVFTRDRYQKAFITQRYQQTGTLDCVVSGSFPSELLNCTTAFLNIVPLTKERFRLHNEDVFLKNIDMSDDEEPQLNGWEVVRAKQKRMQYDPLNSSAVEETEEVAHGRSLVLVNIQLRRAGWSLPILVYTPFIVVGILISAAWITSPSNSVLILCSVIYILTIFVKDSVSQIPAYSDRFRGLDAAVVFLWLSCGISLFLHLLLCNSLVFANKSAIFLSPIFKLWPLFVRAESRLLDEQQQDRVPLQVQFVRTLVALVLVVSFVVVLTL